MTSEPDTPSATGETDRPSIEPLPPDRLRWACDLAQLTFASTADLAPVRGVIGQDAALEALRFGLSTGAPGQNIFVRGLWGTGRLTSVRHLLEELRPHCPVLKDRCYVHNFLQRDRPRLITLPAGQGQTFRRRMDELAGFVAKDLPAVLSSEGTKARLGVIDRQSKEKLEQLTAPFEASLREAGLALVSVQAGSVVQPAMVPLINGRPVPPEEFEQLRAQGQVTEEQYEALKEASIRFQEQLAQISAAANEIRHRHAEAVRQLMESLARGVLGQMVSRIESEFPDASVKAFLAGLTEDLVTHRLASDDRRAEFTRLCQVNVVLEHDTGESCPIVVENSPTLRNLLGTIDYEFGPDDEVRTSHTGVQAGALLRADGGYLLLEAHDVISEPGAWTMLVRTLRTGRLEISPPELTLRWPGPSLKPEPIDVDVKVILLGDARTYYLLDAHDSDFPQLFKVLADFDTVIPRDAQGVNHYAGVLARIAAEEDLPPFDRSAVGALAEHGARIAARQGKMTARFGRLADVAREAAFVASRDDHAPINADDVREAVRNGRRRNDLPARHFIENVAEGRIRLTTSGQAIGQLNGVAVLQAGPLTYGFPTRITATVAPGTAGVINIEREADLSGSIHTKGFYILGGLLRSLLRTDHPLAFDASIAFEQSYGGIDGDSASGAETCCLISALTRIPLRQDMAMTGAIDQMGHVMTIGAVNEKIEGVYDACQALGAGGTEGMIIPRANAGDLMLRADVIEACAAGRFHVYAVDTIHAALELLTGMPTPPADAQGHYAEGSVLDLAVRRARDFWLKSMPRREGTEARRGGGGAVISDQ